MNFAERARGVFIAPQPMFKALAERPKWVDALVVVLLFVALSAYLSAPFVAQDTLKMMKDNAKLEERLGKERYAQTIKNLEAGGGSGALVRAVAFGPAVFAAGLFLSALILLILGRMVSSEGSYVQILAVLAHANFIDKILGAAVRTPLIMARQSVFQTSTSLALFFPKLDFSSTAYIFVSQVDFFQIWMFALVGYGLSAAFKIPVRKAMILSYSFWFLKSLVYIALAFVYRSFLG
jgi:hypothetical protein